MYWPSQQQILPTEAFQPKTADLPSPPNSANLRLFPPIRQGLTNHVKQIAIGQLLQETNTLNPVQTTRRDFEAYGWAQGPEVVDKYGDVGELAGLTQLPEVLGASVEWVGLLRAVAWSGGPLEAGLLGQITQQMTRDLSPELDGVLLSLHGAQSSVENPDVSGHVLASVRAAVGPDVPVVATLDLHANVTARMAGNADALVGYHTFPHIDHVSCGKRAAVCLARLLEGDRASVSLYKIPMVPNNEGRTTDKGLHADFVKQIVSSEQGPGVLSVGFYNVQPWFDVPELGWSLYQAWFDSDHPPFDPKQIAADCWQTRDHREIDFVAPTELVQTARAVEGGPVAVSESHDATNSGAPGDSTHLLGALIDEPIREGGGLCFCVDPDAVAQCEEAGAGATLRLTVGGKRDPFSDPITMEGLVEDTGDLQYRLSGHGGHNLPVDMGRFARVRVRDTTVVLVEKTGPGSSPLLYEAAGVDPRQYKVVLAKSPEGFRADYEPFASAIIYAAAPGCATPEIDQIDFQQTTRPLWPQDEFDLDQATWAGEIHRRSGRELAL